MSDYRSYCSWRGHHKRRKLVRRLGRDADLALRELWAWCADPGNGRTDGDLAGMSAEDIAISADDYAGDPEIFVATLVELHLLDGDQNSYRVHDWLDWQPWAANAGVRSQAGRIGSMTRWHKRGRHHLPIEDCPLCVENANRNAVSDEAMQTALPIASKAYEPQSSGSGSNSGSNSGSGSKPHAIELPGKPPTKDAKRVVDAWLDAWPKAVLLHRDEVRVLASRRLDEGFMPEELLDAIAGNKIDEFARKKGLHTPKQVLGDADRVRRYASVEQLRHAGGADPPSKEPFVPYHRKFKRGPDGRMTGEHEGTG